MSVKELQPLLHAFLSEIRSYSCDGTFDICRAIDGVLEENPPKHLVRLLNLTFAHLNKIENLSCDYNNKARENDSPNELLRLNDAVIAAIPVICDLIEAIEELNN